MRICFFGVKEAFDFFNIGGSESFIRRIATCLVSNGHFVDYILIGSDRNYSIEPFGGLSIRYRMTYGEAIREVYSNYDHVVTTYIPRGNRIEFGRRRRRFSSSKFHFIYFSWPDSLIKRLLYFLEARVFPFSGRLICISQRQYEYVKRYAKNAIFILPPVPEQFFVSPEEKCGSKKIRVTFLGRIDMGKGIDDVIAIFKDISHDDRFEVLLCGIHIKEDKKAVEIHRYLQNQRRIRYLEFDRELYDPEVENTVRGILKDTDIMLQPYQRMSSTIDTPLILLESMASLCAVLTKPYGNISDIYGRSPFIIPPGDFRRQAIDLIRGVSREELRKEQLRIYECNKRLMFGTEVILSRLLTAMSE